MLLLFTVNSVAGFLPKQKATLLTGTWISKKNVKKKCLFHFYFSTMIKSLPRSV